MTIPRRHVLVALAAFASLACSQSHADAPPSDKVPARLELRALAPESRQAERVPAWKGPDVAVGDDRLVLDGGVLQVRVVRDPERDGMALSVELADETQHRVTRFTGSHVGESVALIVAGRAATTLTVRDPVKVPALLLTARDDATVREMQRVLEGSP